MKEYEIAAKFCNACAGSSRAQTLIINGLTFFTVTALWPVLLRLSQKKK